MCGFKLLTTRLLVRSLRSNRVITIQLFPHGSRSFDVYLHQSDDVQVVEDLAFGREWSRLTWYKTMCRAGHAVAARNETRIATDVPAPAHLGICINDVGGCAALLRCLTVETGALQPRVPTCV
jgi:hypothetical protein